MQVLREREICTLGCLIPGNWFLYGINFSYQESLENGGNLLATSISIYMLVLGSNITMSHTINGNLWNSILNAGLNASQIGFYKSDKYFGLATIDYS